MGMAASQARFLGLTSRKSNVEYQVQQINQQRTALANESAGLYNQMMELSVPTPPSANAFYKTNYVLEDTNSVTNTNYIIVNMNKVNDGTNKYNLVLSTYEEEKKSTISNHFYVQSGATTNANGETVVTLGLKGADGSFNSTFALLYNKDSKPENKDGEFEVEPYRLYSLDNCANPNLIDGYNECKADNPELKYFYKDASGKNYFLTEEDWEKIQNNEGTEQAFGFATVTTNKKLHTTEVKAEVIKSDSGRITNLVIDSLEEYPEELRGRTVAVSTTQEYDEVGYDHAYNDYVYEKDKYEKMISDINAKTETIQAKDKSLELKIKQLDTEENAIQTEMDSVQKVIETNVEKTFNIFA